MVKCPNCGGDVTNPVKTWLVSVRKPSRRGNQSTMTLGIFECANCKARFRAAVDAETRVEETGNIKNMVERIKGIRGELMQTLKNLREKINTLETERSNLMIEIEKLRKVAESKAVALEGEVIMLREEVKSLRELLGYSEELEK